MNERQWRRAHGLCERCGRKLEEQRLKARGKRAFICGDCLAKRTEKPKTLCWDCVHSVPKRINGQYVRGCEWSIKRLPVIGWEAETKILRVAATDDCISYNVKSCPKFEKGR